MTKNFFEVFPVLQISGEMKHMLEDMQVQKVVSNKARTNLRIYLHGSRLIQKKNIFYLERNIKKQLFPQQELTVKIIENYQLSAQYTAETLMDVYKDSILEELKAYSLLVYNLFRCAQIEFDAEDHMRLHMEDTIVARNKSDELLEILYKIMRDRCGLPVTIEPVFEPKKENRRKEQSDAQIEFEVRSIVSRYRQASRAGGGFGQADDAAGADDPDLDQQMYGQSGGQQGVYAGKDERYAPDSPAGLYDGINLPSGTAGAASDGMDAAEKTGAADPAGRAAGLGEAGAADSTGRITGTAGSAGRTGAAGAAGFGKSKPYGKRRDYPLKRSDNPDVVYGRDFEDEVTPIDQIAGEMGEIAIRGKVIELDTRELRSGEKSIVIVTITDFTDSIVLKIFAKNEQLGELLAEVKKGAFLKIKGVTAFDRFDSELTLGSIAGIKKIPDFTERRMDTSPNKRIELHCHTKMSDMDGISDVGDIIRQAIAWGHKALAITDHGAVQAFPIANHAIPKGSDFKLIYGVEAYLVDDLKSIVFDSKGQSLSDTFVVFDLETTGLSTNVHKIIEIGAVKVADGKIVDRFSRFVNPKVPIPFAIEELTKIRDDMVIGEPEIDFVLPEFMEFCRGCVMVAHNAEFDMGFIRKNCEDLGLECDFTVVDTVAMARYLLPNLNRYKLDTVAKELRISLQNHHRAVDDAGCTAEIFLKFIDMLHDRGIFDLEALNEKGKAAPQQIQKMPKT